MREVCTTDEFAGDGDIEDRGDDPGEMGDSLPAVDLGTDRTAKALAAGWAHTCALLDDDSVKCWGNNESGQLGLGDTVATGIDRGIDAEEALAPQPDGRLVADGRESSDDEGRDVLTLARYLATGAVGPFFTSDSTGISMTAVGQSGALGRAVAGDLSGRVVVAGETDGTWALARFQALL